MVMFFIEFMKWYYIIPIILCRTYRKVEKLIKYQCSCYSLIPNDFKQ